MDKEIQAKFDAIWIKMVSGDQSEGATKIEIETLFRDTLRRAHADHDIEMADLGLAMDINHGAGERI